ncbi:hypothetical protein BGZ99_005241 [Dissophora globulifera]|uniref:Uncharacterized protein n=1 Tax=Dissophora globulifera TaxID=979702 RepID=A0A9P6RFE9_9FUNG|nr:hypothetical protein BGZ99_005241 [Dissophora globulifera]
MSPFLALSRTVRPASLTLPLYSHVLVCSRPVSLVSRWPSKIEKNNKRDKKSTNALQQKQDQDPDFFPPLYLNNFHYNTGLSRLREHYRITLQDDLMVLTYNHASRPKATPPEGMSSKPKRHRHIRDTGRLKLK